LYDLIRTKRFCAASEQIIAGEILEFGMLKSLNGRKRMRTAK